MGNGAYLVMGMVDVSPLVRWMNRQQRKLFYWWRYARDNARWDTNITPPEVVALIEDEGLPAGRALDLGCGTGTNSIYLAQQGWQSVGVDFVAQPVQRAREKAHSADVAERTRFIVGDVTQLARLDITPPFQLALDMGCSHGIPDEQQAAYVAQLADVIAPDAVLMLYAHFPHPDGNIGALPQTIEARYATHFTHIWTQVDTDAYGGVGSAWYRFQRR